MVTSPQVGPNQTSTPARQRNATSPTSPPLGAHPGGYFPDDPVGNVVDPSRINKSHTTNGPASKAFPAGEPIASDGPWTIAGQAAR